MFPVSGGESADMQFLQHGFPRGLRNVLPSKRIMTTELDGYS